MRKRFKSPFALTAATIAVIMVLLASLTDIDLVQLNIKLLEGIEKNEVDDLITGLGLVFVGLIIDSILARQRKKRKAEVEEQRLRVLKATMRTVQDIVGNFLNNLQLFRMEAESVLSPESSKLFDSIVKDTASKLTKLGNLQATPEKQMAGGVGIDLEFSQK
jgi:hypothetical protein